MPGPMAGEKGASARLGHRVRFLCDAMLGGLAKWLRAAGYDTYYAREEQLRLVVDYFDLDRRQSRCMECNGELEGVPPGAVAGRVPPGVIRGHEEFFLCKGCGRVFWRGSHWDRISGRLSRVFG
jgi:uncharacterized protein with PIN domain